MKPLTLVALIIHFVVLSTSLCFSPNAKTQTEWTKRTVVTSLAEVRGQTSMINGFIIVGQPLTGRVRSTSVFGWLGMLPITQTDLPLSVDEDLFSSLDNGKHYGIRSVPNPSNAEVVILHNMGSVVETVYMIDEMGRATAVNYQIISPESLALQLQDVASGVYSIVLRSGGKSGACTIVRID